MGTLRVRNLAQKVLWEEELSGQISDGRWENSRPWEHWVCWSDADVVVDPQNVGRDFYAQRDVYCFTEKELLSIIGERMLEAVRVATGNTDYSEQDMIKDLRDIRKIIKIQNSGGPVPPQPQPRKAKLIVDGWAREFTVYTPTADDPKAAEKLAAEDRRHARYRLGKIEKELVTARATVKKLEKELAETRVLVGTGE